MNKEIIDDISFNDTYTFKQNPIHFAAVGIFIYLIIQNLSSLFSQFLYKIIIDAGTYKLSNLFIISSLKLIFTLVVLIYFKNKIKKSIIVKKKSTVSIFRTLILLLIVSYLLQTGYVLLLSSLFIPDASKIGGFGFYDSNLILYNSWLNVIVEILTLVIYGYVLMTDKNLKADKI